MAGQRRSVKLNQASSNAEVERLTGVGAGKTAARKLGFAERQFNRYSDQL
jgi:hypothetical protein